MENKSFDDIIKNKMDQFSSEIDSNSWELFQESQLDAVFDDAISNKVSDFKLDEVPSDFDKISDRIPSGFDALIGAKLAGLALDGSSDWDQFEKILDGDEAFDEKVADAVESYEVPLSESQWPKLAEHLAKVEKRRRRIVITKFIEAAVFILFILTIMQLYPIQDITKKTVFRTIGVTQDLNSNVVSTPNQETKDDMETESDLPVVSQLVADVDQIIENIDIKEIKPLQVREKRHITYRARLAKVFVPSIDVKEVDLGSDRAIAYLDEGERNFKADIQSLEFGEINDEYLLATLDIKDLESEKRSFQYPVSNLSSLVKKDQYWFNVYGSPALNLIHTPYDRSYDDNRFISNEDEAIEAYSHASNGYSIGASISKETANLEIEGGVEYTSLNYFPLQIEEVTGKATTGFKTTLLKEIIFDIIEIPVNIKYNIFRKKGWKVYGSNGVSAGLVAFANYDIDETVSKPLASLEISGSGRAPNESSFVDRKEFNNGFVRSKSFEKNAFATISAGFGVSKEISDKIAFYVQPTYHHNLSQGGLGPNNDVHHRLSVQIGTKVRI